MSKIREKESLECGRMHIWALKTQKLPGPLSGPWTPAANCSLRSRNSASLRRQLSASAPGAPPLTKSWIRTCITITYSTTTTTQQGYILQIIPLKLQSPMQWSHDEIMSFQYRDVSQYKFVTKAKMLSQPWYIQREFLIFTARKFAKVMFLHLFVSHSVHGEGVPCTPPWCKNVLCLQSSTKTVKCGRYASYWNAVLVKTAKLSTCWW